MKSLFNPEAHKEIMGRLDQLESTTQAKWGKMTVGQMLWHCQGPFNIMLEKHDYNLKPNWLAKVFFKKSLYSDKPWRKGLPTAKFLKAKDTKDFSIEKPKLVALINETFDNREKEAWNPHPGFGYFTNDQWGKLQYKHMDHHLRQFGV